MRRMLTGTCVAAVLGLSLTSCTQDVVGLSVPPTPTGLAYQLQPSGDPNAPSGILLSWDPVADANLEAYNVYSRASASDAWGLRGTTTSPTFHDSGVPDLDYYVTAVNTDGGESDPSDYVEVDERLRLEAPDSLTSISLNGAIHLSWTDNAYQAAPTGFDYYRVYSASYDLDNNVCGTDWALEGTTVSPEFLVGVLTNGVPRCFGVSAISVEGFESLWSPLRYDTPRPDGHNILLYTQAGSSVQSGFRFFRDLNNDHLAEPGELGIVGSASDTSMDLILTTDGGGNLLLTPQRTGDSLRAYVNGPIGNLTDIDVAPVGGYSSAPLLATPEWGYVVQMNGGDGYYRYGSLRLSAVGSNYVIFDWAYQTDPGNPELVRMR